MWASENQRGRSPVALRLRRTGSQLIVLTPLGALLSFGGQRNIPAGWEMDWESWMVSVRLSDWAKCSSHAQISLEIRGSVNGHGNVNAKEKGPLQIYPPPDLPVKYKCMLGPISGQLLLLSLEPKTQVWVGAKCRHRRRGWCSALQCSAAKFV